MSEAVSRWEKVCAAIKEAEHAASRPSGGVTLVAVSKTYDADAIWPVIKAGQRVFGENRVREAMGKWPALRERLAAHHKETLELHLIGPLQSNKAKEAVATFDVIESVDRDKIAGALAKEMAKQDRHLPCTVQVNTGLEPQKAGIAPADTAGFVARCREVHGLIVQGLMCIPPVEDDPAKHFALLAKLAEESNLPIRSMGMSGDYEIAIAHGATHVRVGSAIFGPRGT
ncbi:MAG: YggS family pyridoxal phosphate-dependent enzyme [Rhizobiales bacterium]|nr:YggS family pyridoxal phosphate-dependent enzyme [Hyphomicrobiales bacterium]MBO6699516.1 YggS family pyridoxal phosphate-dependent enzyme [Hyphomicrobiales bacterium]MBO6737054.1 YggS family pyridoxal phosphate-dependent enzyme [Hyphomicrobiales bacterium]MBO6911872.1 YggS family pyridoxal phosphate-dependent enzyme [Hyphomicrobiales bacterium]MBO6954808.1 YggS family pyridoxal phosphate-dependent enzyme [Hyphomicrobiales bacterium]